MTRICILGNSHVACIKHAWDEIGSKHPNISLTFFAARGWGLDGLVPRDGCLHPDSSQLEADIGHTSGGLRMVDLSQFDCCVIHGLVAKPRAERTGRRFFSEAVRLEAMRDHLRTSTLAYDLVKRIRTVSKIPVVVSHAPLLMAVEDDDVARVSDYPVFLQAAADVFAPLNASFRAQPPETIVAGTFTSPEYGLGSRRLDVGDGRPTGEHPGSDRRHMNHLFGIKYLDGLFASIQ